jgi:peptidoglycan/LPS O-acetylase OafA/YrhL
MHASIDMETAKSIEDRRCVAAGESRSALRVGAENVAVEVDSRAADRLGWLDSLRVLGIVGVVWIHCTDVLCLDDWERLGRFAVPFFTAASALFVFKWVSCRPQGDFRSYFIARLLRIYLPFLGWSAIYSLMKLLGAEERPSLAISVLWTGTCTHLWFLPFLLVMNFAVYFVARTTVRWPRAAPVAGGAALILGTLVAFHRTPAFLLPASEGASHTFAWGWLALPSALWAIFLAATYGGWDLRGLSAKRGALLGLALAVLAEARVVALGRTSWAENLAGVGCLLVAFGPCPGRLTAFFAPLGKLSYGVYLSHAAVMHVVLQSAQVLHLPRPPLSFVMPVVLVGAYGLAWSFRKCSLTSWLSP